MPDIVVINDDAMARHMEEVNEVALKFLSGMTETEISKELSIPRNRVVKLLGEWRDSAVNNEAVRARAKTALSGADIHYNKLIRDLNKTIKDADEAFESGDVSKNQAITARLSAIKMIADFEAKRIDMLQKAGLLENQELADQMMQQEKEHEAIMGIITEVVGTCPTCKPRVLKRMQGLKDEPLTVVEGQVD